MPEMISCGCWHGWNLRELEFQHFYAPQLKIEMIIRIVGKWSIDGVLLHYNQGWEVLCLGIVENKLALLKARIPIMAFEGNMGYDRELDEPQTIAHMHAFMESLGLRK